MSHCPATLSHEYTFTRPASSSGCDRVEHVEALDFFGVAAGGGKQQHGLAERAPADDLHLLAEAVGVPAGSELHFFVLRADGVAVVAAFAAFAAGAPLLLHDVATGAAADVARERRRGSPRQPPRRASAGFATRTAP